MKPKYNSSQLRNQSFGASLVTAIVVCFSGSAFATTWVGGTSTAWNDDTNWSGGAGTGGSNAVINTIPANIATISANIVATPVDILVGTSGNGRLIHTAGTASTGVSNWMRVGGGVTTGTYDLANTSGTGGALTGYALGSGNMTVGGTSPNNGRLYVGKYEQPEFLRGFWQFDSRRQLHTRSQRNRDFECRDNVDWWRRLQRRGRQRRQRNGDDQRNGDI